MNTAIEWESQSNADTLLVADGIAAEVANLLPTATFSWVTHNGVVSLKVDAPTAYDPQYVWVEGPYDEVVVADRPGRTVGNYFLFPADTPYEDIASAVVERMTVPTFA